MNDAWRPSHWTAEAEKLLCMIGPMQPQQNAQAKDELIGDRLARFQLAFMMTQRYYKRLVLAMN